MTKIKRDAARIIRNIGDDLLAVARFLEEGGSPEEAAAQLRNAAAGLVLLADTLVRPRSPASSPEEEEGPASR